MIALLDISLFLRSWSRRRVYNLLIASLLQQAEMRMIRLTCDELRERLRTGDIITVMQ